MYLNFYLTYTYENCEGNLSQIGCLWFSSLLAGTSAASMLLLLLSQPLNLQKHQISELGVSGVYLEIYYCGQIQ